MALVPFPGNAVSKRSPGRLEPDWDDPDLEPQDDEGGKMSFLEHLDELRRRLVYAVVALVVGFIIACFFITPIFDFIMRPLQAVLPEGGKLVYTEPGEAFTLRIKMAAIAGLLLASAPIMAQVWLFVAPGLYAHEKKFAIPFVAASSLFFVSGAAFSHYVVFPMTWNFFASFDTEYVSFLPRIDPAFGLYMKLLIAFGLVFQMPIVVLALARMGVITARFMVRKMKYAVLVIFILAAAATPGGDAFVQAAMAGPMILLYVLSIGLAWMFGKKKPAEEPE